MGFPVLFACDVRGCNGKTFHDKPYCPAHDHLYPQVQSLRKQIQERENELHAVRLAIQNRIEGSDPVWKVIPAESPILREIRVKLEAVEIRTLRDIAQAADLTCAVAQVYLQALEAAGAIRIKWTSGTRISTVSLVSEAA